MHHRHDVIIRSISCSSSAYCTLIKLVYLHVIIGVLPKHVQVKDVIKRCEAQSAAGKGRCSELERYMTNCIKVGRVLNRSANCVGPAA